MACPDSGCEPPLSNGQALPFESLFSGVVCFIWIAYVAGHILGAEGTLCWYWWCCGTRKEALWAL